MDWERYDISSASLPEGLAAGSNRDGGQAAVELTAEEKAELERKRKLAFNAPKRIKKIEVRCFVLDEAGSFRRIVV